MPKWELRTEGCAMPLARDIESGVWIGHSEVAEYFIHHHNADIDALTAERDRLSAENSELRKKLDWTEQIVKAQEQTSNGMACAEERAAGNGGCGACSWCCSAANATLDRLRKDLNDIGEDYHRLAAERAELPLLCRYPHGTFMLTYIGGRFKHTNGSLWAAPLKWAYITWIPDIDLSIYEPRPHRPEATGQWLYDTMRVIAKHHKIRDVRDVMDAMPWPNDTEGEPEPSAGGTQP